MGNARIAHGHADKIFCHLQCKTFELDNLLLCRFLRGGNVDIRYVKTFPPSQHSTALTTTALTECVPDCSN